MDHQKILIWNVRGLNKREGRDNVRKVIDDAHPSIVCLQGTKLALISEWDIRAILGRDFRQHVYLPTQGTRGGILVAWHEGSFSADHWRVHGHSVSVKFSSNDQHWWLTGVYGPHQDSGKVDFLNELQEVRDHCQGPWMLAGDSI